MINLEVFNLSLKTKWVKMYIDPENRPWKCLFDYYLSRYGASFLFKCNYSCKDLQISNTFILNVCQAWSSYSFQVPDKNYGKQIILNNYYIKIDSKPIFRNCLLQTNAIYVKDFFDCNGAPLSYVDFVHKFNLGKEFSYLFYFGIIDAIPTSWKTHLQPCEPIPNHNTTRFLTFCTAVKPTPPTPPSGRGRNE